MGGVPTQTSMQLGYVLEHMPTSSQLKIMSTWNYKKNLIAISCTYHFLLLYILVHFYTTMSSDVIPHLCNANIAYLLSDGKSVLCCLVYTCIKVFIARCTWLHVPDPWALTFWGGDWCTLTRKFTCPCLVPEALCVGVTGTSAGNLCHYCPPYERRRYLSKGSELDPPHYVHGACNLLEEPWWLAIAYRYSYTVI